MRILHTGDWHIGKTIRGRSRRDEHEAVLAEIASVARTREVDLILVAGDVFDSAAPTAESEQVAYRALLELASTGADLVVLAGNHDNPLRLQAVAPLLALGRIEVRATFLPPAEGGVIVGTTKGGEPWRVATVPFLSQRWVVKAVDLLARDGFEHGGIYADRVAGLVGALTAGFDAGAVNVVAAHLMVDGGLLGGGERSAHTIFEYAVSPAAFPSTAHYVALGHLHRAQVIPGPCPIRYAGSPLQLDFGETADVKSVYVVTASPGVPAAVEDVPLTSGRRLRTVSGTLDSLRESAGAFGEDWLRVVVAEPTRVGLGDEVRELFPTAVDIVVSSPVTAGPAQQGGPAGARRGRTPRELFAEYLAGQGVEDPRLVTLFDRLFEESVT